MSQFEQLGQLFMVGLPGTEIDNSTLELINELGINNFIIFRRNVENPEQLKKLCGQLKEACTNAGLFPPLVSIDQEGGTVARLPEPFSQFVDARVLAQSADPEAVLTDYAARCVRELVDVGINMNLAPVLDVCPAGRDLFMEKRSFGEDPEQVGRFGCHVALELQKGGIAACGKHFPGLGAATLDPHLQLPVVTQSLSDIEEIDLIPFQRAIAAGIVSIMTSHTIYTSIDDSIPATLSRPILTGLLRNKLGYDGLVITDDLEMGAIENERTVAEAAVQSFIAGADMLLICHDHKKVRDAYERMKDALQSGDADAKQFVDSVQRVVDVRSRFA